MEPPRIAYDPTGRKNNPFSEPADEKNEFSEPETQYDEANTVDAAESEVALSRPHRKLSSDEKREGFRICLLTLGLVLCSVWGMAVCAQSSLQQPQSEMAWTYDADKTLKENLEDLYGNLGKSKFLQSSSDFLVSGTEGVQQMVVVSKEEPASCRDKACACLKCDFCRTSDLKDDKSKSQRCAEVCLASACLSAACYLVGFDCTRLYAKCCFFDIFGIGNCLNQWFCCGCCCCGEGEELLAQQKEEKRHLHNQAITAQIELISGNDNLSDAEKEDMIKDAMSNWKDGESDEDEESCCTCGKCCDTWLDTCALCINCSTVLSLLGFLCNIRIHDGADLPQNQPLQPPAYCPAPPPGLPMVGGPPASQYGAPMAMPVSAAADNMTSITVGKK